MGEFFLAHEGDLYEIQSMVRVLSLALTSESASSEDLERCATLVDVVSTKIGTLIEQLGAV